jgi:phage shock protein C
MAKKLYRSKKNRKIAGVCGGIAEYFDIDPIIIRLITLILALSAGGGLIAYIIAWIVVPEEPGDALLVPVK